MLQSYKRDRHGGHPMGQAKLNPLPAKLSYNGVTPVTPELLQIVIAKLPDRTDNYL
jgi:hypothetical protein